MKTRRRGGKVLNVKCTIGCLNRSEFRLLGFVLLSDCVTVLDCVLLWIRRNKDEMNQMCAYESEGVLACIKKRLKRRSREKKKPRLWFFRPTGRTKQTGAYCRGSTLTVTALDLFELRVLSAWLINTSFSFNGAGASRQPSKALFIWVIYVFPRGAPRGRGICPHRCAPQRLKARGKLIGLSLKNK